MSAPLQPRSLRASRHSHLIRVCVTIEAAMSHEGIRFVSPEEAEREEHAQRELPHDAKDPAKVRVHKTEGTGLEIDWKDGHHSAWSFQWLRDACPCATSTTNAKNPAAV